VALALMALASVATFCGHAATSQRSAETRDLVLARRSDHHRRRHGFSRTFVFTAWPMPPAVRTERLPAAAGIDLHRSNLFVPVESLIYINGDLGPDHARRLTP